MGADGTKYASDVLAEKVELLMEVNPAALGAVQGNSRKAYSITQEFQFVCLFRSFAQKSLQIDLVAAEQHTQC